MVGGRGGRSEKDFKKEIRKQKRTKAGKPSAVSMAHIGYQLLAVGNQDRLGMHYPNNSGMPW